MVLVVKWYWHYCGIGMEMVLARYYVIGIEIVSAYTYFGTLIKMILAYILVSVSKSCWLILQYRFRNDIGLYYAIDMEMVLSSIRVHKSRWTGLAIME